MYRNRSRPKYSDEELAEIYATPWEFQWDWKDHVKRQLATVKLAEDFLLPPDRTAADLSCGDAYFRDNIRSIDKWHLGDFAVGYEYVGPIEQTIDQIPPVDVFFCCETLEHLDDPEKVLRAIRAKSSKLIISTPIMKSWDENPQHYWAWDKDAVKHMLLDTGWNPLYFEETFHDPGYCFQIWGSVHLKEV